MAQRGRHVKAGREYRWTSAVPSPAGAYGVQGWDGGHNFPCD